MYKSALVLLGTLALTPTLFAQRNRLAEPIHGARVRLTGHVHPRARTEFDQGRASASLEIPSMSLVLKPSAAQQADLDKLLVEQQDPASPNYHRWLTPQQYADRFGLSADDLSKVVTWIEQQGLEVISTAQARNMVYFRGHAAEVEKAFGVELHNYQVDGELHFANATEPGLPADLSAVVRGIRGLNDFRMKARLRARPALDPQFTSASGKHTLSPNDFATIYNLNPLYNAGINGSGQKVVIVGQTQVDVTDLQQYRTLFNLTGSDPQMILVPNLKDPGISKDDLPEADLDLELISAVARGASVMFVYSFDVTDAVQYAIDQNLAPVISMSYGLCETQTLLSDAMSLQAWAKQANAQGITWVASSGDSGGADCAGGTTPLAGGNAVDLPAGVPEVTAVGGTEFVEGTGAFWNTSNDANGASARSYIPETVWNDSIADGQPSAGGGGVSSIFLKPSWQTGAGVPADGARDVPDISLSASADHDGYRIFTGGSVQIFGGTSASAPAFAGIVALLNHRLAMGGAASAGNINPALYRLVQVAPEAFHDVTSGDNKVTITCGSRSRNCTAGTFGSSAGPGYDLASGLGSVDANNFISAWVRNVGAVQRQAVSMVLTTSAASIDSGASVTATAQITNSTGAGQGSSPTGTITFLLGSLKLGTASLSGSASAPTASLTLPGADFPLGGSTIIAQYSGDGNYLPMTASASLTVLSSVTGTTAISGFTNAASFRQSFAPGMLLSIFGSDLAPSVWSAQTVPLPTQLAGVSVSIAGVAAPLYFVSPAQLNVQIPYEATVGSSVLVNVNNTGHTASLPLTISAAAPGIFLDSTGAPVPSTRGSRGSALVLFITGDGALSPALATGASPAQGTDVSRLPQPQQPLTVTVGGEQANVFFAGVPPGLVGVTQVNYTIPSNVAVGTQAVIVSVGNIASPPAKITVTN